ncbi:MAG: acyl-CoA dehydrogenase, partial [Pseudomonadota bacterium]
NHSDDAAERQMASRHIQVLNPLGKAYCSDMAWILIAEAIQVYGGYGFCEEYPVEKLARDSKINSIWEGTNYVQSMDLVGRKWSLEGGDMFRNWLAEVGRFIEEHASAAGLEAEFALLKKAYDASQEIYITVTGYAKSNRRLVATFATRVLHAMSMTYCGCLLAEQALLALRRMGELGAGHYDYPFYQGKVLSALYYIRNVVPSVWALADVIKSGDTSVLDIPEECF